MRRPCPGGERLHPDYGPAEPEGRRARITDLAKFLRASESAKAAAELETISAKPGPFRDYKLKAFADFLEQAEAYSRGALAPKVKGGRTQ